MIRQIIALGGGGFTDDPKNSLLDDYLLKQSPKKTPHICFIGTASGDAKEYINNFYNCFDNKECNPSHISLFQNNIINLEEHILKQDIIFVGGSNTRNLLVLWKEWGVDEMLKKAYDQGIILSGVNAGSACWFDEGLTGTDPENLSKVTCLSFLKGSNCPLFDSDLNRQIAFKNMIEKGEIKPGIACDYGVAIHFINEKLEKIVASRKNKHAYQYEMKWMLKEMVFEPTHL